MRLLQRPRKPDFEALVLAHLKDFNDTLQEHRTLLSTLLREAYIMADNQVQLDAAIAALQTADTSLQSIISNASQNILSVVQSIKSKLAAVAGSAPTIDLGNEVNALQSIGNDFASMSASIQGLSSQVSSDTNPPASGSSSIPTSGSSVSAPAG